MLKLVDEHANPPKARNIALPIFLFENIMVLSISEA
jgi:hypothetical protein